MVLHDFDKVMIIVILSGVMIVISSDSFISVHSHNVLHSVGGLAEGCRHQKAAE